MASASSAPIKGSALPGEAMPITFGSGLPGYVTGPAGAPAVIVIQEWWGVVPTTIDHALRLSQSGYRCLIPDLYKGKVGVDKEEASHLLSKLDWPAAVDEIKQAVAHLRGEGAPKVGCTGFCMGGALTLAAAQHAGLDAAASFYGIPGPEICQPEKLACPTRMHHGELDGMKGFSDPESAEAFAAKARAAGVDIEAFIYPQCGHGFLNVGDEAKAKRAHMGFPEPPQEQQELAWQRVLQLFDAKLKA